MLKDLFKKFNGWTVILTLSLGLFAISCSEDDSSTEPSKSESQIILEYLEANGDFINTAAPAIVKADAVHTDLITNESFYLIDIRAEADFNNGHIEGAHNVALADLLDHAQDINAANYERIIIICYTGQTTSYGASLLRLAGYDNVYTMKWGMTSWDAELDKWSGNLGNSKAALLETTANEKPKKGSIPTINTGKSDATAIIEARIQTLLAEGFGEAKVSNDVVFSNLNDYFVINYWPESEYLNPGHIPGAYQFTPKSGFKSTEYLLTLPTDKEVVVYCYTGQTSAYVTAYLRLLGYNAKTLLFGANGMFYDIMPGHQFNAETEIYDYDLVTE